MTQQNERLLTDIAKLIFKHDCPNGDWAFAHPIQKEKWLKEASIFVAKTRQATLKEVGEHLEKVIWLRKHHSKLIESLKRGERPE